MMQYTHKNTKVYSFISHIFFFVVLFFFFSHSDGPIHIYLLRDFVKVAKTLHTKVMQTCCWCKSAVPYMKCINVLQNLHVSPKINECLKKSFSPKQNHLCHLTVLWFAIRLSMKVLQIM